MAKGTTFGTIHSNRDLMLIQQSIEISPAIPRINIVDVPGANGGLDLTEALGVGVLYKDREIKWTFALYPGANWAERFQAVSGSINGLSCHITLDDDPGYYYDGRLQVYGYKFDALLRQITVKATCRPYKRKQIETTVSRSDISTNITTIVLNNDRMPVIPTIKTQQDTTLNWGGNSYTVNAGTHVIPEIRLSEGRNELDAKVSSGLGTISIVYREGAL